jgi:hypothetical protein
MEAAAAFQGKRKCNCLGQSLATARYGVLRGQPETLNLIDHKTRPREHFWRASRFLPPSVALTHTILPNPRQCPTHYNRTCGDTTHSFLLFC